MISTTAFTGARGIDTDSFITTSSAAALKQCNTDFVIRYLGSITQAELSAILGAGLAFMPVTFANVYDPKVCLQHLSALSLPAGCTVWLDVEGVSMAPAALIQAVTTWASVVKNAGYDPGIYVGAAALLTSQELFNLPVDRYWHGLSKVEDRHGMFAEPACGWTMYQCFSSVTWGGVWSDIDFVQADYLNRLPSWVVSS